MDNKEINERDLLQKLSKGSEAAFSVLFTHYYADLVLFAGSWLKGEQEACEDMVQEVFLRLWSDRAEAAGIDSLKSFLLKAVQNRCISYLRHKQIESKYAGLAAVTMSNVSRETEHYILYSELRERLDEALEILSPVQRKCFEMSRFEGVKQINKDLYISVRGNFTYARNKVLDDGKYYAYPWQDQRGVRYGLTLGYKAMHLFSQEELDNMPDYYTQFGLDKTQLRAGDIRYEDLNDDGKITEADMTWIGNPSMPEIVYGFGASLNYKGLDFSVLFQGGANRSSYLSGGWYFYPFQAERGPKFMGNVMTIFQDRWTPDNPNPHAFSPRLTYGTDSNNYKTSTWWQRDSDYLRLKNVEIGYTLPGAWANKLRCSSLRIYAMGVNLVTFSKFISDYWDPETGADSYPMQRQVYVGVNLTF